MIKLIPISLIEHKLVAQFTYGNSGSLLGERTFTCLNVCPTCAPGVFAVPYALTIEALPLEELCEFYLVAAQIRGCDQMQTTWHGRDHVHHGPPGTDDGYEQIAKSSWHVPIRDNEKHFGRSVLDPKMNDRRALRLHWDPFEVSAPIALFVWTEQPCSLIVSVYGEFENA